MRGTSKRPIAPMSEPATFTTYEAMIAAMRQRRIQKGLSQLAVDELAGLPSGYCGKLEAILTNPNARNARGIGRDSLPLMLGALGLELGLHAQSGRASKSTNETIALLLTSTRKAMSDRGRKGAEMRQEKVSPAKRRAIARKAARARWEKYRKEKTATKRSRQPEVTA